MLSVNNEFVEDSSVGIFIFYGRAIFFSLDDHLVALVYMLHPPLYDPEH